MIWGLFTVLSSLLALGLKLIYSRWVAGREALAKEKVVELQKEVDRAKIAKDVRANPDRIPDNFLYWRD